MALPHSSASWAKGWELTGVSLNCPCHAHASDCPSTGPLGAEGLWISASLYVEREQGYLLLRCCKEKLLQSGARWVRKDQQGLSWGVLFDLVGRRGGGDATSMPQRGESGRGTCPCKWLTENLHSSLVLNRCCPRQPQAPCKAAKGRASTGGGSLGGTPDLAFPCGSKCAF